MEKMPPQGLWPPRLRHETSTATFCWGSHQAWGGPSSATMSCHRKGWPESAPAVQQWLQMVPTATNPRGWVVHRSRSPAHPEGPETPTGPVPCHVHLCLAIMPLVPLCTPLLQHQNHENHEPKPAKARWCWSTERPPHAQAVPWPPLCCSENPYGRTRCSATAWTGSENTAGSAVIPAFNPFKEPAKKEKLKN